MSHDSEKKYLRDLNAIIKELEKTYGKLPTLNKKRKSPEPLGQSTLTHKDSFEWNVSRLLGIIYAYNDINLHIPDLDIHVSISPQEKLEKQFNTFAATPGTHSYFLNEMMEEGAATNINVIEAMMNGLLHRAENSLGWQSTDSANQPITDDDKTNYQGILTLANEEWSQKRTNWSAQFFTKKTPLVIPSSLKAAFALCDKLGIEKQHEINVRYS